MLVQCEDCGAEMSDLATQCPQCGRPSAARVQALRDEVARRQRVKRIQDNVTIASLLTFVFAFVFLGSVAGGSVIGGVVGMIGFLSCGVWYLALKCS